MPNSIQPGTPSNAALATTLVSSAAITGAAFALGKPQSFSSVVDVGKQFSSKHPIENRRIIYGTRGQLGGTLTYVTTSPTTSTQHFLGVPVSENGNIHMVLTFSGHGVDGFLGGLVTDVNSNTQSVPLIIYLDGYPVPLTVNGVPAFGGGSGSYVDINGLPMLITLAPTDGAYYVPTDFVPPKINGKTDKAHDYRWRIRVEIDNGDPSNTSQPFPLLASDTSVGNPGSWGSTCLQRGCAKAHVQLVWDKDRFNNGLPNIGFTIAGKKVYDPRLSPPGYTYSENAALCLYDFMTDTKAGLKIDPSRINQTLLIAAANKCDEAMVLREGGTQPRYSCNGVVDAGMKRGDVVQKMLDAMAGTLVPPGSEWKMYAGGYSDPVMTITDSDLRGPIKIDTTVSRKDLANGAKGTFISADNGWQAADYPPYLNSTYVTDDGGDETFADFSLDFVSDSVQAQRLAKIKVEKIRHNAPLVLQCKMTAFKAEVNDTIAFTHPRWGLSAATYVITNTALVVDDKGGAPVLGYDIVCVPASADDYAWDPDVDEGTVVVSNAPLLPDNTNVGAPTGVGSPPVLGLESDSSTTIIRADGIAHSQILVTWTPPTDHLVLNGGYIEIFIKKVGDPDTDWLLAGTAAGDASSFYIDKNITDGIDYDVEICSLNAAGSHSEFLSASIVCSGASSTISSSGGGPGPVGVANNDFEASNTLPPTSWTLIGSPTLAFEISSQQQGLRSLKITSSLAGEGVQTSQKYGVVPGDMYTGEQYKVGGYIKGDGTGHGAIVFRFYNASDVEVGTAIIADGGNPTPASWNFYSATGAVDNSAVYARVSCENRTTGTSVLNEFDSIVLFRVASLEDEVVNGPSRGAITAANSSYRPLSNPLTAQDDGFSGSPPADHAEIDIASFTMRSAIGPTDVSLSSGVITGLLPNTVYHVYYDDPTYAGGAVTYLADTTQAIALDATGRFYVGSIKTPITGGLPTIGNNDGGTGAQSGKLYMLFPTLRADYDVNGNQTWYPANEAETDDDSTTYFDLAEEDTIWLGGIPDGSQFEKWTDLKLKIRSEVDSVTAAGAAFLDYSLDDGQTWTNIYNVIYGSDDVEGASAGANAGSGTSWTNPGNIADQDNYATLVGQAHGTTSKNLQATGFGFAIPSGSVIDGITVSFDEIDGGSAEPAEQSSFTVQMLKAGVAVGTPKTVNGVGTGTLQLGNNADLWGTSWTYGDINASNFGFEIAAVAPVALGSWATGTYYSPMAMIIDSNGNYQIVATPGTSGGSHPTWSIGSVGSTTADGAGSLVWALYQRTGLTFSGGQAWNPGNASVAPNGSNPDGSINTPHFITVTAGGVSCVFELTKGRMPRLGNMAVYAWPNPVQGAVNLQYPLGNPPSAPKVFSGASAIQSLHWYNSFPYNSSVGFHWYAINGDGTVGSGTAMGEDSSSTTGAWQADAVGQMVFPAPGNYTFQLWHDDGMIIAFDPAMTTKVSGVYWNVNASQRSPVLGYPWMAGQNASTNYSGNGETAYNGNPSYLTLTVKTPTGYDGFSPITVGFELAYTNWEHSGRMIVTCQDSTGTYQEIVPVSTPLKTAAGAPTWPAWSTSLAPSWPSVTDAGGNFIWVNRGPATDFTWAASTAFTAAGLIITGSNGYKETAYRAGVDGASEPTWGTSVGGLKTDGSSLTWRNIGGYTPSTTFDFSVRGATIDVAYLPPGAANTRAAATDEVTLALTQKLSNLQVRYGLTLGGEMKVYQVWVEAQAG
jgi:hypothetical protein